MPKGKRGRPATRLKLNPGVDRSPLHQRGDKIRQENFDRHSEKISFRQGSKGALTGRLYLRTVWQWDEKSGDPPRERRLLIREDESGGMKYSLTNLPPETPLKRLARIQGQRYWIEHAFHEAKNGLGMARYQVRVWQGWHHHMALICLATVFMMREKQRNRSSLPLLSCRDIVDLLDHYLEPVPESVIH